MLNFRIKKTAVMALTLALAFVMFLAPLPQVKAADHAESTSVALDPGADLADVFAFLDPNDNSKVILSMSFGGFVVPSQAVNLGYFLPEILYRFEIENTGDAVPDKAIDITFSAQTSKSLPQTATISLPTRSRGRNFITAPTTVNTLSATANPFVVTRDPFTGVSFYAGLADDPFYFDIVGFNRFVSSVLAGSPDPTRLQRARDSFAGYSINTIALSVPADLLRGSSGNIIGVNAITLRQRSAVRQDSGQVITNGDYVQVDRAATPAVNTALIPFPRKNEFNASTPVDDANGRFANSIVATLTALGTNSTNIGILASVAVTNGDYLHLNLGTPNTSVGFGERATTPGYTGFPNGRRPGDDTVDVLLYFITNQAITMGDNVNSNEVPLGNTFPFVAPPHRPLENPAIDDKTRN
ncbi:DUF4331 domain-containing protein [soil metagenome]